MWGGCGKLPNHPKSAPGWLWKRLKKSVIFSEKIHFFKKKSGKIQKNSDIAQACYRSGASTLFYPFIFREKEGREEKRKRGGGWVDPSEAASILSIF